jgi:ankyrin repeat protein
MRTGAAVLLLCAAASLVTGCEEKPEGASTRPGAATGQAGASTRTAVSVLDRSDPASRLYSALLYRQTPDVRRILDENPDLANANLKGTRPLAIACESRNLELVRAVIEKGADVNAKAADGWSVLFWAVANDSVEVVKYLILKGADPKAREVDGETLLWAAPSAEMANFLISKGIDPHAKDNFGDTALHAACRQARRDVVEVLLNAGIHVETKGRWDMPPLHSAASSVTGDPRPVVNLLLQRGAKINSKGFQGHTVIHEAAFYNRYEMADLLLSNGAEPHLKDANGQTPMDLAYKAGKDERIPLINLLIRHGAPGQLIKE